MFIDFINVARAATETAAQTQNTGAAGLLGLNLKLFIAQLVNFGIVLLVLWKWVFRPVSLNMKKRTEKIDQSLKQAAEIAQEKEKFDVWKTQEMSLARKEARAIIEKSKTEAESLKNETLIKAKSEQAAVVAQAKAEIELEKQQALKDARGQLAGLVTLAAEKILREKLDANKDRNLISNALKQAAASQAVSQPAAAQQIKAIR